MQEADAEIVLQRGREAFPAARPRIISDRGSQIVAKEGRAVFANMWKFLTYVLSSNIAELVPYLAFVLLRIPLPLTIIQILAIDLGTDLLPALSLGAEKPDPGTMKLPPRSRRERLLNGALVTRAYGFLGLIQAVAGMGAYFFVLRGGGWHYGEMLGPRDPLYLQATTAFLSAIVVTQIANVFVCRSARESVFRMSLLINKLILAGIAVEIVLVLLINYTPWGNAVFGTARSRSPCGSSCLCPTAQFCTRVGTPLPSMATPGVERMP